MLEPKPYKWVQVVTTVLSDGSILQLIATTDDEDKNHGLNSLLQRHNKQLRNARVVNQSVCYMNSNGAMSNRKVIG